MPEKCHDRERTNWKQLVRFFFITFALWLFGVIFRTHDLVGQDPQGDEILWIQRSAQFLEGVVKGQWTHATSHLGHPGIPAVVSMATIEYLNSLLPPPNRTDILTAARLGNALFSALLVPAVFWALRSLWGPIMASFVAVLVALDVQLIAIARLAHIDSSLAVMVSLCVATYFRGTVTGHTAWKVLAGFLWGLSIASKPTAMVLLPAFFLFNLYRTLSAKWEGLASRSLVSWADVWAVFTGLGTLAAIFTRFWHHEGPFLSALGAESELADQVYRYGIMVGSNLLTLLLGLVLAVTAVALALRKSEQGSYHGLRLISLCSGLVMAWALVPAVLENFIRYFTRLPHLAEFVSKDAGYKWEGIPFGYLGVVLLQTPIFVLALCIFGSVLFVRDWRCRAAHLSDDQKSAVVLATFVLACWLGALSTAAKQFVRYIIPVLPFLYLFAGYGVYRVFEYVRRRNIWAARLVLVIPAVCGVVTLVSIHPMYLNFYNSFVGGLQGAYRRGYPLFYNGHVEVLRFLESEAQRTPGTPKRLVIAGEYQPTKYAYENYVAPKRRHLAPYVTPILQDAEYVIATRQVLPILEKERGFTLAGLREVYTSYTQGVPLVSGYEVPPLDFKEPVSLKLLGLVAETGGTTLEDHELGYSDHVMVYALPERHTEGILFAGGFLRIQPGSYSFTLSVAQVQGTNVAEGDGAAPVLSVVIDDGCLHDIVRDDVVGTDLHPVSFHCDFKEPRRIELRGHWHGNFPLVVDSLTISRR